MAGSRGTAGPGDIIDLSADEAEDLIAAGDAVAVEEPAPGDAGPGRNPPSAGPFSDEEWWRGIELPEWVKWRSPATYEKHKEYPTSATARRLCDVVRAGVREGRIELGVSSDSIFDAVQPIHADALDRAIDAINFTYPMVPFAVHLDGKWVEIRVYRAGRLTGVPAGDASGTEREATPPPAASVERRGAKPKYEWDEFWAEVTRIIHDEGLPATQAELEKRMLGWCADEWGEEPSLSSVRTRLSKVYRRLGSD